jgi:hypothetical protein
MAAIAGDGARSRITRLALSVFPSNNEGSCHVSQDCEGAGLGQPLACHGRSWLQYRRPRRFWWFDWGGIGAVGGAVTSGNDGNLVRPVWC